MSKGTTVNYASEKADSSNVDMAESQGLSVGTSSYVYEFEWPYRIKEFEKELAKFELERITAIRPESTSDGLLIRSDLRIPKDELLRVSSFHLIKEEYSGFTERLWTTQAILEKSVLLLKRCRDQKQFDASFAQMQDLDVKRREKQYSLHELHSYKGRYYPQVVRPLITSLTHPGQRLLDPFCGCGTSLIESHFAGTNSVGVDLNPIAYFITRAKIGCFEIDIEQLAKETNRLLKQCDIRKRQMHGEENLTNWFPNVDSQSQSIEIPPVPNASEWFSEGVLAQLSHIKALIQEVNDQNIRDLFLLAVSSIVKKVSNWDPGQVRQQLLKSPRKDVDVFDVFRRQLRRYYMIVYAYRKMVNNYLGTFKTSHEVFEHDSRHLEFLEDESFDCIVTSPPYATALPYLDTDRLPMYILGMLKPKEMKTLKELMIGERDISLKRREEIEVDFLRKYDDLNLSGKDMVRKILLVNKEARVGFRRRNLASTLYKYLLGMKECISEMERLLRLGGHCCVIIGDNSTRLGGKELFRITTHEILKQMLLATGMKLEKEIAMEPTSAYMVYARNMIRNEYILIFKKQD